MKVVHVITGLQVGGAESMLVKLLAAMDRDRFDPVVVSLMRGGPNRAALAALDVPVHELGMRPGLPDPVTIARLSRLAGGIAPDVVQGWMYHGNLAATWLAARAPGRPDLLWNIRHSVDDLRDEKLLTRLLIRLGGRLSHRPRVIVCNSRVSLEQHAALGYARDRLVTIPNGFDLERFRPDPVSRRAIRAELDVPDGAPLVGMVARRHPMKGHADFLKMAARVHADRPGTVFLMAGRGLEEEDGELAALISAGGLDGAVRMVGSRSDVPAVMAALDVFVMASTFGEGFPNVLGEAMASGVPCVTTDVGDAADIVGAHGAVVARGRPGEMAREVSGILDLGPAERETVSGLCRDSIRERFALDAIARRYEELYAPES